MDCACQTALSGTSCSLLFRGVKEVKARPMTASKAVEKGYKIGFHETEDGYEVVYEDGYKSWSPKAVFEKAYKPVETFRDRLIIERDELNEKLRNLIKFLGGVEKAESPSSDGRDMELMSFQRKMMQGYLDILNERIGRAF